MINILSVFLSFVVCTLTGARARSTHEWTRAHVVHLHFDGGGDGDDVVPADPEVCVPQLKGRSTFFGPRCSYFLSCDFFDKIFEIGKSNTKIESKKTI